MNFSFSATDSGDVSAPSGPQDSLELEVSLLHPRGRDVRCCQPTQHVHSRVSLDAARRGAAHTLVHGAIVHLHVVDAQCPVLRDLKPRVLPRAGQK